MVLFTLSLVCLLFASLPWSYWIKQNPNCADITNAFFHTLGSLMGFVFIAYHLNQKSVSLDYTFPFRLFSATLSLRIDTIALVFLSIIYLISAMSAIYSINYWSTLNKGVKASFKYRLGLSFFTFFMLLLIASDSFMLFLLFWEIMSLWAYFLITLHENDDEAQDAGYLYLIATHTGVVTLFGLFALLQTHFNANTFSALAFSLDGYGVYGTWIFLLGLFGFGLKAGIFPLYFWLPTAHASAPVPISALLSGVMIKMGIYGIVRTISLFEKLPTWWGWSLLGIGIFSGILGVVYAIAQHDIKRLLAYHSIENIGIIVIGLGMALLGKSYQHEGLVFFGITGAFFHVINHSIFKSLLFYSAGSIIETYHTRSISAYGGIINAQPYTALFFLMGAIAISGIPPFNGFASEWLLYTGMFQTLLSSNASLVGIIVGILALALIGGLALACFVKVFGLSFLGIPRTITLDNIKESSLFMLVPMGFLAFICLFLGLYPSFLEQLLTKSANAFAHQSLTPKLDVLVDLSTFYFWFILLTCTVVLLFFKHIRGKITRTVGTWACAFSHATPKAQYSASSLAQMIMEFFTPTLRITQSSHSIKGLFTHPHASFHIHHNDGVIFGLQKSSEFFLRFSARIRSLVHNGYMGIYVLYILIALLVMLFYVLGA